eukprot:3722582-Prymnesium_polylepis.1
MKRMLALAVSWPVIHVSRSARLNLAYVALGAFRQTLKNEEQPWPLRRTARTSRRTNVVSPDVKE